MLWFVYLRIPKHAYLAICCVMTVGFHKHTRLLDNKPSVMEIHDLVNVYLWRFEGTKFPSPRQCMFTDIG